MVQIIFDINKIRENREFARDHMNDHAFLFDKMADSLVDKLKDIQRDFQNVLVIGERGSEPISDYFQGKAITLYDVTDDRPEISNFETQSFDCVICIGYLHAVNDVTGFLKSIKSYLKPDGLFLCGFFGGNSLQELRQSIINAEIEKYGGASQHIHPMIDHYSFAGLLQSSGLALPVVDYDRVHVRYSDLQNLYNDLKYMGEGNALIDRERSIRCFKGGIEAHYKSAFYDDAYMATFDIIYGIGWAPHDNQQKPARRGSGDISLTEVL
jgi:NADH dehydrogenase [ubiquinone] 1 alpha subcomplex assembly factor 5